jgi:hypothetical protein
MMPSSEIQGRSPYVNRSFVGTYHFHLQGREGTEQETIVKKAEIYLLEYEDGRTTPKHVAIK